MQTYISHVDIYAASGLLRDGALLLDGTQIAGVFPEDRPDLAEKADQRIDGRGLTAVPGYIDIHVHGGGGHDIDDGTEESIVGSRDFYGKHGVTAFAPTYMALPLPVIRKGLDSVREVQRQNAPGHPEVLNAHLEGPFINPERKGAQNPDFILPPDAKRVLPFADIVRLITLAPEMAGGYDCIRQLKQQSEIAISMGHSSATFEQAMTGIGLGVTRVTHLFNAMTPLHHRDPGVVGAALNSGVYTELIADTFHVNKGIYPMLAKAKGSRLVLITDALRSAGMPDGEYENGGQTFVLKGIECRLLDGTIAGSVLRMNQGVRNFRDYGGVTMAQAVHAASLAPAESIGMGSEKGSLTPGKDADIVLLDDDCQVLRTIVRGVCKYSK